MKKLLLGAALALATLPAHAGEPSAWPPHGWFKVTKPIAVCEAQDEAHAAECTPHMIQPGELLEVDRGLDVTTKFGFVRLWRGVCPHGCVPAMTPVYVMLGDWIHGKAFERAPTPKGWR